MSGRGKFITLEGVDGAGKSSHVQFIADTLAARGHHVIVTREPGGTDLAERLRKAILEEAMEPGTETLLLVAARADHVHRVVRPALSAGTWIICDRFADATAAYQGAGKGVSMELIERLGEVAHAGLHPDRTLLFDCPYEIAAERLAGSGKALDRFERENRAFFERVRAMYIERSRAEPGRIRVIDSTVAPDAVRAMVEANLAF